MAAIIVLILFLVDQLQNAQISATAGRGMANLLAAAYLGFLTYLTARFGKHANRIWTLRTETAKEFVIRATPIMFSIVAAMVTAFIFVMIATEFTSSNTFFLIFLEIGPLLYLSALTFSNVGLVVAFRTNPRKVFAIMEKPFRAGMKPMFVAVIILALLISTLFIRYLADGILELSQTVPDWLLFGKLMGGGMALYVFEFWMGSLICDRNESQNRLVEIESLHYRVVAGELSGSKIRETYEEILDSRYPQELSSA